MHSCAGVRNNLPVLTCSSRIVTLFVCPMCHTIQKAARLERYARTGTLAVRSILPQLTHAPLMARRIAFQMQ